MGCKAPSTMVTRGTPSQANTGGDSMQVAQSSAGSYIVCTLSPTSTCSRAARGMALLPCLLLLGSILLPVREVQSWPGRGHTGPSVHARNCGP